MDYNFDLEVKLHMLFEILGDTERTGPLLWKVNRKRTEDIKNHILDLMLMVRFLKKYLPDNLDYDLINDYILCHDLPEAITGDITKFEGISEEEIKIVTTNAIDYLIQFFNDVLDFSKILIGYEERINIEAKIVHMLDKIQSTIPFMKYQLESCIDVNNPKVPEVLRKHPFVVEKIKEGKDLADIFYEYHLNSIKISDEECEKYNINRKTADLIVNIIKSYASSIYSKKQSGHLLLDKKEFPKEATLYNRNIN